jgi:hypothetical protein
LAQSGDLFAVQVRAGADPDDADLLGPLDQLGRADPELQG